MEKDSCWQYVKKKKLLKKDLESLSFSTSKITVNDCEFVYVDKTEKKECKKIKEFIERYEWLGKMPARPTHRFEAIHKGILVGVVVMATPYAFCNLLGKENSKLEKLIARGASISWAPHNLGSWLIMKSINWMVKHTPFRFFTGYSDTKANELGTIYQACNFIYLGKNSGTKFEYYDPQEPQRGWFSDRLFRKVGQYKKYARSLGIEWQISWNKDGRMLWGNIPPDTEIALRSSAIQYRLSCHSRLVDKKHKYTLIQGRNKTETKLLLKLFAELNPDLAPKGPNLRYGLPYPKCRGT